MKELAEITVPFNSIIKKYPNGDIFVKRLNFTSFKKEVGYVEHETNKEKLERLEYEKQNYNQRDTYASFVQDWKDKKTLREYELLSPVTEITKDERPSFCVNKIVSGDGGEGSEQKKRSKILYNIAKTRNKIHDIARSNDFNLFITLTFNSEKCDRYSFQECSKKVRRFMNNFGVRHKEDCPNFKYLLIHEQHKDGAYHYHGLIYLENEDLLIFDETRTKQYNRKHKQKLNIYNWSNWKNGFSTVSKIQDQQACRSYILKYVSKNIDEDYQKGQRHFYYSQNCLKPSVESVMSNDQLLYLYNEIYSTDRSTGYEINQSEFDLLLKDVIDYQYGIDI